MALSQSDILRTAHVEARRNMSTASGRKFYGTYRAAFADCLRAVYASARYDRECEAKYGPGMRPGFQIIEPRRLWA